MAKIPDGVVYTLADDLMTDMLSLAQFFSVSKSSLKHYNSGIRKFPASAEQIFHRLRYAMTDITHSAEVWPETTLLLEELSQANEKPLNDKRITLQFRIMKLKNEVNEMERSYEHAIRSFNNIHYALNKVVGLKAHQRAWLSQQHQKCKKVAMLNSPGNVRLLMAQITGLQAELDALNV